MANRFYAHILVRRLAADVAAATVSRAACWSRLQPIHHDGDLSVWPSTVTCACSRFANPPASE